MKFIITTILFLAAALNTYSQERYQVKLVNDTVYNNNIALFVCKRQSKEKKSLYFLRNLENKPLAVLLFEDQDSALKTIASFPILGLRYGVLYPKIDVVVLLESYVRNKIIVNGAVDTVGLKTYCETRQIMLQRIPMRKAMRPGDDDSLRTARLNQEYQVRVNFTIVNSSAQHVSVNIGTPSSNRTQLIAAGASLNEHGHIGEKVCILDKDQKVVACRIIKKEDTGFTINKSATGYE